jgi:hypothetical protein
LEATSPVTKAYHDTSHAASEALQPFVLKFSFLLSMSGDSSLVDGYTLSFHLGSIVASAVLGSTALVPVS